MPSAHSSPSKKLGVHLSPSKKLRKNRLTKPNASPSRSSSNAGSDQRSVHDKDHGLAKIWRKLTGKGPAGRDSTHEPQPD